MLSKLRAFGVDCATPQKSFIFGVLSTLGYAPLHIFPAYFVFLGLLFWALENTHYKKFPLSYVLSFVYGHFFASFYWVVFALGVDWPKYWPIAPLVLFGLPLIFIWWYLGGLYLWYRFFRKKPGSSTVFALVWTTADLIRSYAFTGFPWNLPANIWTFSPLILSLCSYLGTYGLSALTTWLGCSSSHIVQFCKTQTRKWIGGVILGVFSFVSFLDVFLPSQHTSLPIHLVQPNIAQVAKMNPEFALASLKKLQELSIPPVRHGHFILWPEGALPFAVNLDKLPEGLRKYFYDITAKQNSLLATGIRFVEKSDPDKVFNSMFLINPQGYVTQVADKVHLLPFGEFMPFRSVLPKLLADLAVGPIDMAPGEINNVITLKSGYVFKPLVCFESLFTNLVDPHLKIDALIIVTNDAWFGKSSGPYQHLSSGILRAAELGLPVIRIANTGISAVIDGRGRVLHKIGLGKEGTISTYLPQKNAKPTFYYHHRWVGLLMILCLQLLTIILLYYRNYPKRVDAR